ncbi:MAG TPA: hypothetical protein DHV29_00255 [Bacteroidales bacterium]|nr:MAG: hypothetical protein A2W94_12510 [Bacteroidetes bacterium GWE2_42_42]HCB62442.1 hypothetical protein [Bacteroidales bacterium]HCY21897.1 hypothetical protein [Bacteroidales bacterium]
MHFVILQKKPMRYLSILVLVLFIAACGNKEKKEEVILKLNPTDTLDKLLSIKNEAELIEKFGNDNVTWDTVYGAEGAVSMATLLYKGTCDQVEITWKNIKNKTEISKVTLSALYDEKQEKLITFSHWKTSFGIRLGTSLKELETMNEVPFIFFGFGWDYGGIVSEFNSGKLTTLPISLQLGITDVVKDGNNPDYEMLMGDNEFNSDDAEAQRLNPVVISISVLKK